MKERSRSPIDINFDDYLSPSLDLLKAKRYSVNHYACCASACISMITGANPIDIDSCWTKPFEGARTKEVIALLKAARFNVVELTKQSVLNTEWYNCPLQLDHCLLVNCCVNREENSMVIMHKGEIWHNFKRERNPSLYFLNKPTQDVLLVHHKKWIG